MPTCARGGLVWTFCDSTPADPDQAKRFQADNSALGSSVLPAIAAELVAGFPTMAGVDFAKLVGVYAKVRRIPMLSDHHDVMPALVALIAGEAKSASWNVGL